MKTIIERISGGLLVWVIILSGCESNKDPAPAVDCSQSDLELTIDETQAASGCTAKDGSITVSAQGGQGEISYSIDSGTFQASGIFTELAAGNYTITAQDENECQTSSTAVVAVEQSGLAINNIAASDAGCKTSNGQLTVDASGQGTLMFMLNGGSFQASNVFSNLSAGTYEVVVKDESSCEISTEKKILHGTSYKGQVKSIIEANCAVSGCHDGSNGESRNFNVFANVQNKANSIKTLTLNGSMPPPGSGYTVTAEEKDLIACWVDDGALNN